MSKYEDRLMVILLTLLGIFVLSGIAAMCAIIWGILTGGIYE